MLDFFLFHSERDLTQCSSQLSIPIDVSPGCFVEPAGAQFNQPTTFEQQQQQQQQL